jgi:hypothetical protein
MSALLSDTSPKTHQRTVGTVPRRVVELTHGLRGPRRMAAPHPASCRPDSGLQAARTEPEPSRGDDTASISGMKPTAVVGDWSAHATCTWRCDVRVCVALENRRDPGVFRAGSGETIGPRSGGAVRACAQLHHHRKKLAGFNFRQNPCSSSLRGQPYSALWQLKNLAPDHARSTRRTSTRGPGKASGAGYLNKSRHRAGVRRAGLLVAVISTLASERDGYEVAFKGGVHGRADENFTLTSVL